MKINIEVNNLKPHLWGMLSDTIDFIRIALEECGIQVMVGVNQIKPDILNLFFDQFDTNPSLPLKMKILKLNTVWFVQKFCPVMVYGILGQKEE